MGVTNLFGGTRIDEIADGIYRISTVMAEGAFSHNQYLIADEEPLLFHTGARKLLPLVVEAVETVMPFSRLAGDVVADEAILIRRLSDLGYL